MNNEKYWFLCRHYFLCRHQYNYTSRVKIASSVWFLFSPFVGREPIKSFSVCVCVCSLTADSKRKHKMFFFLCIDCQAMPHMVSLRNHFVLPEWYTTDINTHTLSCVTQQNWRQYLIFSFGPVIAFTLNQRQVTIHVIWLQPLRHIDANIMKSSMGPPAMEQRRIKWKERRTTSTLLPLTQLLRFRWL